MRWLNYFFTLFLIFTFNILSYSQGFDNATRSLYILDISKYVKWNEAEFAKLADFNIGVLSNESAFYWELVNAAKTRQFIQQKPIKIKLYRNVDAIEKTQVLFVPNPIDYNIKEVLKKVKGNHTLLISENSEFRLAMINFKVVDNQPRFEANENLINEEGLKVSQLFLAQAIKTREEWEQLFEKTDIALTQEKETVKQQNFVIEEQKNEIEKQNKEIQAQRIQLAELDKEIQVRKIELLQNLSKLKYQANNILAQSKVIEKQKADVSAQMEVLDRQKSQIISQTEEIKQHEDKIKLQNIVLAERLAVIEKQKLILWFSLLLILSFAAIGYFIYRSFIIKKKANIALEQKNKTILAQKAEIEEQRDIAQMQRDQIAFQKRHIMDSIEYAKRIQSAILPSLELFSDKLEHFVLYKPKDIVSGDFYWQTVTGDELIIVVADCTGHGVPGAFMSMLGVSLLNDIVNKQGITQPNIILNKLRDEIIDSLKQKERAELKDGMDITVCSINFETNKLFFSGANNPLYLIRKGELIEVKPDKMPVAIHAIMEPFELHEVQLEKGDTLYTFSDGFVDQFGGPNNKKYLSRNFRCALLSIQDLPMLKQGEKLDQIFEEWRGDFEQLDDVTVVGIRF